MSLTSDPAPQRITARIITYAGQQFGLLVAQPNWSTEVTVSMEIPTDVSKEPITFTESRRNFAQSARYKMKWTAYLSTASESTELRMFLSRIRGEPILVPLWPDQCELQNAINAHQTQFILTDLPARSSSKWIIWNNDFSAWDILSVSSLDQTTRRMTLSVGAQHAYSAGTQLYPLLTGRLEERPHPELITDETLEAEFTIKENSAFAARITPLWSLLQIVGQHIQTFAYTPLWNVTPHHSRPLDWTEMPDVVYEHIGFLREEQQRVYDHRTPRGMEFEFYQDTRSTVAKIEYFWRNQRATTLRFMVPSYRGDLRMLANTPVPGHGTWISCEKSFFSNPGREVQPGDPYIALITGDSVDPYQLSSTTDLTNETRLISKTNVAAHTATSTIVSHLLLARFVDTTLEWTYITPYLSTTRLKFMEVVMEYPNSIAPTPPPPLPEPAYLFIFTEAGVRVDRFTSYENTIQVPSGAYAGTYVPAPFSFDTVKTGLKLDQEKLEFKSFKFTGNPLNKMWPFALDGVLTLEIVEVNATAPSSTTAVSRFYGDVWSVDSDYKATAVPFGNLFDRKFPRFLLSVSDNYTQFSPPTNLPASGFKVQATINGAVNHTSQTLIVQSTAAHGKAQYYFAGGWLETGTGANIEKRSILNSNPGSGTNVTLTIDRPLLKAANNQVVSLYPGYSGSIDECEQKFNNRINFGGHPFIPNVNPAVKAMEPKNVQGGKK